MSERKLLPYFWDEDSVLYHESTDVSGKPKILVPVSLREQVIRQHHDPVFAGHQGEKRTLSSIRLYYYWLSMSKDVENFMRKCESRAKMKGEKTPLAPLGESPETTGPMEMTSIDICGPYPVTRRKNRYMLTFICHFTRYPEAIPISIKKRKSLLEPLSHKCSRDTAAHRHFHLTEGPISCLICFKKCVNYCK